GIVGRAQAALDAGCDMVLVCNDPVAADTLLSGLQWDMPALGMARIARMHGRPHPKTWVQLREDGHYLDAVHHVARIGVKDGELAL
ncbi:MAG TPA: hypothetical protein PLK99_11535, partial [Burkholderiales bacterium]|nr:hypothetical protein [Burkholderiales bacterium]